MAHYDWSFNFLKTPEDHAPQPSSQVVALMPSPPFRSDWASGGKSPWGRFGGGSQAIFNNY